MPCCSNCGCNYIVNLPDNPVAEYTAANLNIGGIGVYDSTTNSEFGFRGIISDNAALTVALDAPNFTINLDLDIASIATQLPQATTSTAGVGETATDAEAIAKASTIAFVTPSNFAAMSSSTTFAGLVELATNAETQAGASATLAVTPAGLASVTGAQKVTQVFADAAARAAATPLFEGQFGYQEDTDQPYVGVSLIAGDWNAIFAEGVTTVMNDTTTITLGNDFTINGTGTFALGSTVTFTIDSALTDFNGALVNFNGTSVNFVGNSTVLGATNTGFTGTNVTFIGVALDLDGVTTKIGGVSIPADSVVTTGLSNGELSSSLINTFVSTANVQTGYTAFANPATLRTLDTATATTQQIAQCLGTLIEDLKAVLLPAT